MALSEQDKQELLNAIKAESQDMQELTTVTSLDGIVSLPAMRGTQLVNAPISLLGKPAEDAAKVANSAASAANAATTNANTAKEAANTAAANAASAAENANEAAGNAEEATRAAENVVSTHVDTAVAARDGATARFDEINAVGSSRVTVGMCDAEGGVITYSTNLKRFLYLHNMEYYLEWSGRTGVPMEMYMHNDSIRKDKVYILGETMYVWSDEKGDLVVASGSGSGSGFYNVTANHPLQSGYYTLTAAVSALEDADVDDEAKPGMIITFEVSSGVWEEYRFCGTSIESFLDEASWEEYGGGKIKEISVNGQKVNPDAEGKVNIIIEETEVDETLDPNSTNPVQNSTITGKLSEVEASTVFGMSAELSDDETSVRLALTNKSGAEIAAVDIPAGSGGGGGSDSSTTKVVLNASVDNPIVKEGGKVRLSYTYDHQYSSGEYAGQTTGQKATIEITMKRGSTTTYSNTIKDVSKGTFDLDISKYLFVGNTDIYVRATAVDPGTGKTQTRQSYVSVQVVALSLDSSYSLANSIAGGGYGASDTVNIPYTVSGSGTKVVSLYVDGIQRNAQTVTRSGTTNGSFNLSMSGLAIGRHTVQMVAEMEASSELTLRSESVYLDIFKRGSSAPLIGTKQRFADGRIFTESHLTPRIEVGQYEEMKFDFVVYNPGATPASMVIFRNVTRHN